MALLIIPRLCVVKTSHLNSNARPVSKNRVLLKPLGTNPEDDSQFGAFYFFSACTIFQVASTVAVSTPAPPPGPDDAKEEYGKGVVFYLRDQKVVGVLLWNVFKKMTLARQV